MTPAKPSAPDDIGEIAIRSRYLSPGYWRRPDLTAAAFRPDPAGGPERIYRTGDLGRRLPDGCLVHLGRKDFQVKIRGFRVEVAEVEGALLSLPTVQEAVVVAREDRPGDRRLVAYLVPTARPAPTVTALRQALAAVVPDYMVPAAYVLLDALPKTPGGKVDRRALPPPGRTRPALDQPLVAPRTPVEATVGAIWQEVLGLDELGIHDNFFDLGGHSLAASQVIARVTETLHVDLPLRVLFAAPTVTGLAVAVVQGLMQDVAPDERARLLSTPGRCSRRLRMRMGAPPFVDRSRDSSRLSVYSLLTAQAERSPEGIAIAAPDRAPLTYHRLHANLDATIRALNRMGAGRNDRVALLLPQGPEMAVALMAVVAGATCIPLNPALRTSECEFYFADLNPTLLVLQAGMDVPARSVATKRGIPIIELVPDPRAEAGSFTLVGKGRPASVPWMDTQPDDVALMLYTSGTTSKPKLVPLTHINLCASAHHLRASLSLDERDRCLDVMPLFHIHGIMVALGFALSRCQRGVPTEIRYHRLLFLAGGTAPYLVLGGPYDPPRHCGTSRVPSSHSYPLPLALYSVVLGPPAPPSGEGPRARYSAPPSSRRTA